MIEFNASNYYEELVKYNVATEDELRLVTDINGWSTNTLDDVLYARTANRDWEQYCDENGIENVFADETDEDEDEDEDEDDDEDDRIPVPAADEALTTEIRDPHFHTKDEYKLTVAEDDDDYIIMHAEKSNGFYVEFELNREEWEELWTNNEYYEGWMFDDYIIDAIEREYMGLASRGELYDD